MAGSRPGRRPPAIIGSARRLCAVLAAPGGRHVIYSGQLDVNAPPRRRSFAFVTRVHDLHHPGSLLRRSRASLGDAERAALTRADGDDPGVRDLLRLAYVMATRL